MDSAGRRWRSTARAMKASSDANDFGTGSSARVRAGRAVSNSTDSQRAGMNETHQRAAGRRALYRRATGLARGETSAAFHTLNPEAPRPNPNWSDTMPVSSPRVCRARLFVLVGLLALGTSPALWGKGIGWRTDGTGNYP